MTPRPPRWRLEVLESWDNLVCDVTFQPIEQVKDRLASPWSDFVKGWKHGRVALEVWLRAKAVSDPYYYVAILEWPVLKRDVVGGRGVSRDASSDHGDSRECDMGRSVFVPVPEWVERREFSAPAHVRLKLVHLVENGAGDGAGDLPSKRQPVLFGSAGVVDVGDLESHMTEQPIIRHLSVAEQPDSVVHRGAEVVDDIPDHERDLVRERRPNLEPSQVVAGLRVSVRGELVRVLIREREMELLKFARAFIRPLDPLPWWISWINAHERWPSPFVAIEVEPFPT